jgi:hypothetical protein
VATQGHVLISRLPIGRARARGWLHLGNDIDGHDPSPDSCSADYSKDSKLAEWFWRKLHSSNLAPLMSAVGLGCVKTPKLKFQMENSSRPRLFEKQNVFRRGVPAPIGVVSI